jgi:uncharacterized protein involved in exopolysaccharide biosynthesis
VELLLAAKVLIAALRRRKVVALAVFLTVLGASLSAYQQVGRRYDVEAQLRLAMVSRVRNLVASSTPAASSTLPVSIRSPDLPRQTTLCAKQRTR